MNKSNVRNISVAEEMHLLLKRLFPICRSITGNGVRETLAILKQHIPVEQFEVPSGTAVFDWVVPREWNIKDAYIKNAKGEKIIDFKNSNLHVLNYSIPVQKKVSLAELKQHLHSLPDHPDWIPYRTSYYKEDWGFCIAHKALQALEEGEYEVVIDSSLTEGHLSYGECFVPGELTDEVLISAHICHPSLANDNLSGITVATYLAAHLIQRKPRYSYRFLFIPGTIGAITWLSINKQRVGNIKHGFVASLLGDSGVFTYKKSRRGNCEIDQVIEYVLGCDERSNAVVEFSPYGYDERQFCSPGFNLPVGCLSRTPFGQYVQYHTSADNIEFVKPESLGDSFDMVLKIISTLEANRTFINTNPKCEPQLGRRGLYSLTGGNNDAKEFQMALLWILNLSDGHHSLLDISRQSGVGFDSIGYAADKLSESGLLQQSLSSPA